jgi:pyruvate/2-oxoglutarate dehydrogenase complex dihydrolipoamide dehydrogenase (E3) component
VTIDYDVVIIGGSLVGRYAALTATQLKAKVALVEPAANSALQPNNAPCDFVYSHTLDRIGNLAKQLGEDMLFGLHTSCATSQEKCEVSVNLPQALSYAHRVISNLQEQHSLPILSAQGVDVIIGNGQFQPSPHLAFAVSERLLRARTYLLATGSRPAIPEIEGLQKTGFLTLSDVWQTLNTATPPKQWVILGGTPQSIELAQILARMGNRVTLILETRSILFYLDPDIAQLLFSQLEADGVRVFTKLPVTQVRRIEEKKWLQVGDKAIETDEIIVATAQQPNIESLNLAAVDVKWNQRRLVVNEKLQTTNRRIWACGDAIGGYDFANIANYEARIALQNALFFPRLNVNYQCVPWAVFTNPPLALIGLSEAQAKHRYSQDEIIVLRQYFKSITAAQIHDQTTGICKLIVLKNGKILGASILGSEASELINVIALAMSQNIKVKNLDHLAPLHPTFSEILEQTALSWSQQTLSSNIARQEFLESFFHFRRNWNL